MAPCHDYELIGAARRNPCFAQLSEGLSGVVVAHNEAAFVLGPLMEENLRRALLISRGDPMIFVQRPISLGLLIAAALLLLVVAVPAIRGKRGVVFQKS